MRAALPAAVALLSAASLGYQVLLTRLFAIVLWHHFAFMIISVALLGVGASGTFLSFTRHRLEPRFAAAFAGFAALFGLSAVGCFALAQRVAFNPLEVVWDPRQQLRLLQIYLLLAVPFFSAATCIGLALALARSGARIGALYRADLLGAGTGALAIVAVLFVLRAEDGLRLIGGLGPLAGALALLSGSGARRRPAALLAGLAALSALAWPADWIAPRPSPYKGLSLALTVPGAQVVAERSSPLGLLTVVDSPIIPFRHAPGLSLMATAEPPPQLGVFTDGEGMTAITRFDGALGPLGYLDQQTAALPFHLLDRPRTLILGAGGGADVLLALAEGAGAIDAVELNPQLVALVRDDFAGFAGHLYDRPEVAVHVAEARSFVAVGTRQWDLIQVALLDSFSTAAAGMQALSESTLYTIEAFATDLDHLAPGGMLAITRWLQVPPRDSLKLFATAVTALERRGSGDPGRSLAMISGWNTVTLLVKNGAFTPPEIAALRGFCAARAFDVAYYPGMLREEANRYNLQDEPYLFDGAAALLGPDRARFLAAYKFHIDPATDDRPQFFRFFKWGLLPELLALRGQGGLTLLDTGYLVLAGTLAQAVPVSVVLILLPLAWLGRGDDRAAQRRRAAGGLPRWRVVVYFLALGLAFLFVEIAFIQRFVLFLGHPLHAVAAVLCAFLVFAGLGSGVSARLAGRRPGRAIGLAAAAIAAFAGLYALVLPDLLAALQGLPAPARLALALGLIAPLGFVMGMPFPLGLAEVQRRAPGLVPWAWAINGCASVTGAVLASLLATHFGFTLVILLAIGLYGLAARSFAWLPPPATGCGDLTAGAATEHKEPRLARGSL